jgi:beta-1,2-mannobiose phosphorylase / 1,2-beta-oligomannan phosphorylase
MKTIKTITRRDLVKSVGMSSAALTLLPWPKLYGMEDETGWVKYAGNPVLGGQYGTCFDICVLHESGSYRMWVSWRPKKSVAITESKDGIHWSAPETVLPPEPETGWEDDINRPVVVRRDDTYHMWYTGQAKGKSKIGYATSPDGRNWKRQSLTPVLEPSVAWEGVAVMCPHVMWDERERTWKMWYSGGEQYEPNAIGYATSTDGVHWNKHDANPVLTPDPHNEWEKERVTAAQVVYRKGWYYALYIGFRDIDHAQIGMARSKDGIGGWVRHARNPIVSPTPGGWDADACYKPYAVRTGKQWRLWYNGRHEHLEQIGLVLHRGEDLGFMAE